MNDLIHRVELTNYNRIYLDTTDYPILHKEIIPLSKDIVRLENYYFTDILPSVYKEGIYLPDNQPLILYNLTYSDGRNVFMFKSKEDVDTYFKKHDILYLYVDGYLKEILTRDKYISFNQYLNLTHPYYITDEMLNYINSKIMFYVNKESHCILHESCKTNKLSNVILYPVEYLPYKDISDLMYSFNIKYNDEVSYILDRAIESYSQLEYDLIKKYVEINNTDSLRIKRKSNYLEIVRFLSPGKRRDIINQITNLEQHIKD